MLEFERKIPLSAEEFLILRQRIPKDALVDRQTNFYYDNDCFSLNRRGITCRIREKDGTYTATIKEHNSHWPECSMETSVPAKDEWDTRLFEGMDVRLQGSLTTERVCLMEKDSVTVVIDKNYYLDIVDYEMEIEYVPEEGGAEKMASALTDILASVFRDFDYVQFCQRAKRSASKSARFFERLNRLREERGKSKWFQSCGKWQA